MMPVFQRRLWKQVKLLRAPNRKQHNCVSKLCLVCGIFSFHSQLHYVVLHCIHEHPLRPSSRPPACHIQPQYPTDILILAMMSVFFVFCFFLHFPDSVSQVTLDSLLHPFSPAGFGFLWHGSLLQRVLNWSGCEVELFAANWTLAPWKGVLSPLIALSLTFPQDGEDRQGDQTVGGLLLQREPQAAQEVGVTALRPAHGHGGRGLRADQAGQPPRRGGASHHEEITQHPHHHPVTPHLPVFFFWTSCF